MVGKGATGAPIVRTEGLSRDYTVYESAGRFRRAKRTVTALEGLSLTIQPGESVGYIGANGAGKSTTIKMLTGILTPTRGSLEVCGFDPVPQRRHLAAHIGVVFGQRSQLWWDLPLHESFRLLAALHRLSAEREAQRTAELVSMLQLEEFLKTPVRQLSLGQRMRGEVAAALLHSPRLLVLDEPTIGLDMVSKANLREFLLHERSEHGTTLLLTTHDMSDIEHLCERVIIVDRGRVLFDDALTKLQHGTAHSARPTKQLVLDLVEPVSVEQVAKATWPASCSVTAHEANGQRLTLTFDPQECTAGAVLNAASTLGEVRDLATHETPIEDLVRQFYS